MWWSINVTLTPCLNAVWVDFPPSPSTFPSQILLCLPGRQSKPMSTVTVTWVMRALNWYIHFTACFYTVKPFTYILTDRTRVGYRRRQCSTSSFTSPGSIRPAYQYITQIRGHYWTNQNACRTPRHPGTSCMHRTQAPYCRCCRTDWSREEHAYLCPAKNCTPAVFFSGKHGVLVRCWRNWYEIFVFLCHQECVYSDCCCCIGLTPLLNDWYLLGRVQLQLQKFLITRVPTWRPSWNLWPGMSGGM